MKHSILINTHIKYLSCKLTQLYGIHSSSMN